MFFCVIIFRLILLIDKISNLNESSYCFLRLLIYFCLFGINDCTNIKRALLSRRFLMIANPSTLQIYTIPPKEVGIICSKADE